MTLFKVPDVHAMKHIAVVGRLAPEVADSLRKSVDLDVLSRETADRELLEWADVYVGFHPGEDFALSDIAWVHSLGAGVDGFLSRGVWPPGTLLTRTAGSLGVKIAEYCLGNILRHTQNHDELIESQLARKWGRPIPTNLADLRVAILGTGQIGQEIAGCLSSFGCEPLGVSRTGDPRDGFREVISMDAMGDGLTDVDWVICTLPLTERTEGLLDESFFRSLSSARFINVGRGEVVDDSSLLTALDRGCIALAVLDVFREEPLSENSPFWSHPKVVVTPHIAGVTSAQDGVQSFLSCWAELQEGRSVTLRVDPNLGY